MHRLGSQTVNLKGCHPKKQPTNTQGVDSIRQGLKNYGTPI